MNPNDFLKARFDYASVQVNVPDQMAQLIKEITREYVPENFLADKGYEENPHITLKYGLLNNDSAPIEQLMKYIQPFNVLFGMPEIFIANPDYDVIVLAIHSVGAMQINDLIRKTQKHVNTFIHYVPHMTLAYVQKGADKHMTDWRNLMMLTGMDFIADRVFFSTPNGTLKEIMLYANHQPTVMVDVEGFPTH